jgi:hypothetical protein
LFLRSVLSVLIAVQEPQSQVSNSVRKFDVLRDAGDQFMPGVHCWVDIVEMVFSFFLQKVYNHWGND